jgi:hypothetical protein
MNRIRMVSGLLTSLVAVFLMACQSRTASFPALQTFESGNEGWIGYGPGARASRTTEAGNIKEGSSALKLQYEVKAGEYNSAILPISEGSLAGMTRLRFWLKTDVSTAIGLVLTEKPSAALKPVGAVYSAWFWSLKDRWQRIELTPADFALNEGPGDTNDVNGKLDLDQILAIGLIDSSQYFHLFRQDPAYSFLVVDEPAGEHSIYLDDFEVIMDGFTQAEAGHKIGELDRGFLTWQTLGGAELSLNESESPLNKPALQVTYEQAPGKYVIVSHRLSQPAIGLRGKDKLSFDAASEKPVLITIYLEERNPGQAMGPVYALPLALPGDREKVHKTIELAAFAYEKTSPADNNERLDAERLNTISLMDMSVSTGQSQKNTIWISEIEASAP